MSAYIILGSNQFFINNEIQKIIKNHNINQNQIINYNYNDHILVDITQNSLFLSPKLIIINHVNCFSSEEKIKSNEAFIDYVINDKDIFYVLLVDNKISAKFNQSDFKIIKTDELNNKNRAKIIQNILDQNNLKLSNEIINYLNCHLNNDINIINNEIKKISIFISDNQSYDETQIKKLISSYNEENIFSLSEAILFKDINKVFKIYEDLKLQKYDEITIISILAKQFMNYLLFKKMAKEHYDSKKIASLLNLPIFVIFNMQKILAKIDLVLINSILNNLFTLEIDIKLSKIDKVMGFKQFLLNSIIN